MFAIRASLCLLLLSATAVPDRYDVVVHGGRVMDPETGLDAIRDVGIRGGRIARISVEPPEGARRVDATGLVVAPGFIRHPLVMIASDGIGLHPRCAGTVSRVLARYVRSQGGVRFLLVAGTLVVDGGQGVAPGLGLTRDRPAPAP